MKLHTEPKAPVQAWTGSGRVFKIIQSVVIAGLLLAHFAGAARPAYASPWTPLAWQDGGKLQGWIRDTDGNFVDDLIDEIAAADPNEQVEVIVDFNRCLKDSLGAQSFIESLGGLLEYQSKFVTYAIYSNIRAGDVAAIGARPEVAMVELSRPGEWLDLERQAMKVQSSTTYPNTLASRFGWHGTLNGSGVNIAIVDSGVNDSHAELTGRYQYGYDALTHTYTNPTHTSMPRLPDGHGTAMARIALGTGNPGIAPSAGLIDIKIGGQTGWTYAAFAEALDVILLKRQAWNIEAVNLSIGASSATDGKDALSQHVNRLVSAGIVVVTAAGNGTAQGDPKIAPPGTASWAITVGAADPGTTVMRTDDTIANSTHGPRDSDGDGDQLDELKPEVATSSCCGTSPAAARTSGLAALLIQSKSDINPGSLKDLLIRTAEDRAGADTTVKYPKNHRYLGQEVGLRATSMPMLPLTVLSRGGPGRAPTSPLLVSAANRILPVRRGCRRPSRPRASATTRIPKSECPTRFSRASRTRAQIRPKTFW